MTTNFQFRLTGTTADSSCVRMELQGTVPNAFALPELLASATALYLAAGAHLPPVKLRPPHTQNVPNSPKDPHPDAGHICA